MEIKVGNTISEISIRDRESTSIHPEIHAIKAVSKNITAIFMPFSFNLDEPKRKKHIHLSRTRSHKKKFQRISLLFSCPSLLIWMNPKEKNTFIYRELEVIKAISKNITDISCPSLLMWRNPKTIHGN